MQKKTKHQRTSFINRWTRHIGYVKSARVCQNFLWKYSMWNFQMPGQKRYPSQLTTTRLGSHFKAATSEPPETSRPRKNKHPLQVKAVKQWAHMRTKQKPQQQHIVLHFILGIYGSVVFSVFCHLCVKYLEGRNPLQWSPEFLDAPSCSSQGLNGQCQILHSWLQRSEKGNVFAIYLQVPWNRLLQQGFPNLFLWHLFQNLFYHIQDLSQKNHNQLI